MYIIYIYVHKRTKHKATHMWSTYTHKIYTHNHTHTCTPTHMYNYKSPDMRKYSRKTGNINCPAKTHRYGLIPGNILLKPDPSVPMLQMWLWHITP